MTDETARIVANATLTAAALGATYYVLREPSRRRVVLAALTTALTTTLPAYLFKEIHQAWIESGRRARA